jgi:hypothetical protein
MSFPLRRYLLLAGLTAALFAASDLAGPAARAWANPRVMSGPPVYLPLVMGGIPTVAGCPLQPPDNIWNRPVDTLPVDANSAKYVSAIGLAAHFHADFGSGLWAGFPIGIPYNVVGSGQAKSSVIFDYAGESDPGPYPIPASPLIEGDPNGSGDRHLLIVDTSTCMLYELYAAHKSGGLWYAGSGAIFDLNSNALRPAGWTSADAAGLPILPGLARYEEVAAGEIRHALRFTAPTTNGTYIWPARHLTSSSDPNAPPMGQRFRLKASFNVAQFQAYPQAYVLAVAMQKYGLILADNGSAWYVTGAPDPGWDNTVLHKLDVIHGSDFEAVDEAGLVVNPNSGQAMP